MFKYLILIFVFGNMSMAVESQVPGGYTDFQVQSYYGRYLAESKKMGAPASSFSSPIKEIWKSPLKADKPYHIAVLYPHLKDPYWQVVNYGMVKQMKKYGVSMDLYTAGGYRNLGKQVLQLKSILKNKDRYDGVLIGAVQFKKEKLEKVYRQLDAAGIPVIGLVNDSYTPSIKAKSLVSWKSLGYSAGKFMLEHAKSQKIKVLFLPGAKGTGWAPDTVNGFKEAVAESSHSKGLQVEILPIGWGDTGDKAQRHIINMMFRRHSDIDYLIGNALAINAFLTKGPKDSMAPIKKFRQKNPKIQLISTYMTQEIYHHIKAGNALAAPTDQMLLQAIIGVDMMVRYLNGERPGKQQNFPFRSGPVCPVVHEKNISEWPYKKLFGDPNFKAVYKLDPSLK